MIKISKNRISAIGICLAIAALLYSHELSAQAGANDPSFNTVDTGAGQGLGFGGQVLTMALQPDGKILYGGSFGTFNGTLRNRIARLNADGTLDETFSTGTGATGGFVSISQFAVQPDGKIVVGGSFTAFNGVGRNNIARLNVDGTLDLSFDPGTGADNQVSTIAIQADGKILLGGNFSSFNGTARNRIARLNTDGSLDILFNPGTGANNTVQSILVQGDGKIVIGGVFTTYNAIGRNRIARLNADGTLDPVFNPGSGANGNLRAALQADGKIIIGGNFGTYNGVARGGIARINTDGSLDTTFDPGTGLNTSIVWTFGIQADSKILITGSFTTYNGTSRNRVARINGDGSLDLTFNPGSGASNNVNASALMPDGRLLIGGAFVRYNGVLVNNYHARLNNDGTLDSSFATSSFTGFNGTPLSSVVQPDKKVIVGGSFPGFNGTEAGGLLRLNEDGTRDLTFNSGTGTEADGFANTLINHVSLQADGKIVIGGQFTIYNGTARSNIARINTDGSIDTSFDPGSGANNTITSTLIQADGKIVIIGAFTTYNGTARNRIARINTNGTLDVSFDPGIGFDNSSFTIVLQPDGKIIVGGNFTSYNGTTRNRIARLNADGTLDLSFNPGLGFDNQVQSLALQTDGKIVVGGSFTTYGGISQVRITRVNSDGSLDATFTTGSGLDNSLISIEIQANSKILIGGSFTSFNGSTVNRIARLNANGTLDNSFSSSVGANSSGIRKISLQSQNKAIVCGDFRSYDGVGRNRIARIFLNGTVTPSDSLSLVALYNTTNGAGWVNKANWLTGNVQNWYGVKLRNGRVNSLKLNDNNLTGAIPTTIGGLTGLDSLYLNGNKLTGTIPSQIGSLSELTFIDLGGNQLTGTIPASLYGLTQLRTFGLARNQLTGTIPAAVSQLTQLEYFWIDNNKFSGALPAALNTLNNLRFFYADNNQFTSLPLLTGLNLTGGGLSFNRLDFNSILPNAGVANLSFGTQEIPGDTIRVILGASLSFGYNAGGGANTVYAWQKNFQPLPSETNAFITRASASPADASDYQVLATNPAAPGVTISIFPFIVEVQSTLLSEESGYRFWKKLGAEALGIETILYNRIAVDNQRNIYNFYNQLYKINATGTVVWRKDQPAGAGCLSNLRVDSNGNIFATSECSNRIFKFDPSGNLLFSIIPQGSVFGFDLNGSDELVTVDKFIGTIRVYSNSGTLLPANVYPLTGLPPNISYFGDVAVLSGGDVLISDPPNARFLRVSATGSFVAQYPWGGTFGPWSAIWFTVDDSDNIYLNGFSGEVRKYSASGQYLLSMEDIGSTNAITSSWAAGSLFLASEVAVNEYNSAGAFLQQVGPIPNANGQFVFPGSIAADTQGNRYIVDQGNARVQKFSSTGAFIATIGQRGKTSGRFIRPQGISIDGQNNIYVSDITRNKILKFTSSGVFIREFGQGGTGAGEFAFPGRLAFGGGQLFVLDGGNNRIQVFDSDGNFIREFGGPGTADGTINSPAGFALDIEGNVLVADGVGSPAQNRLQRFSPSGTFLSKNLIGKLPGVLTLDAEGNFYGATEAVNKFDRNLGLLTSVGKRFVTSANQNAVPADGEVTFAGGVHANAAGDTVWVSDGYNVVNRISIFVANARQLSASDSTALVDLYTNTQGSSWTSRTNWLTGPVATWQGVTITGGKVRGISLPGNNLNGTLPSSLVTLDNLLSLNLSGNKIGGATPANWNQVVSLKSINLSNNRLIDLPVTPPLTTTLKLEGNRFTFEDLEAVANRVGVTYTPQDSVDTKQSVLKQLNENHTFTSAAGGTSTSYQWKKNNVNISGQTNPTLTVSNIPLSEDGSVYSYTATNTIVTGLTLVSRPKVLKVSSLQRDSIALRAFYLATGGPNWTNRSNWTTTRLSTGNWFGVTITNNRVVGLNLPNNNLTGRVPADLADINNLVTVNLATNKLTRLPNLRPLSNITALNVSANRLDFASLLPNATITGINYANQADLGLPVTELLDVGANYTVRVSTQGVGNTMSWKRNGTVILNATDSSYRITSINRANQGTYVAEVRNAGVPGLTLKTANQNIFATATLSGKMTLDGTAPVSKGNIFLLKVTKTGGYDTTATKAVNNDGTFVFPKTILDDYILQGKPDPSVSPDRLLIYYKDKLFWEEADTLKVQNSLSGLDLTLQKKPEPTTGKGVITGFLEEDKPGGREDETSARGRVSGATVSVRRVESAGRVQAERLILVATAVTDAEGNFTMPNLPAAKYRLNIQYPGYPMDPNSFITFDIGNEPSSTTVNVSAVVSAQSNKIVVSLVRITEIYEELKLSPYPNPASEKIFVEYDRALINATGVVFTDVNGREIAVESTTTDKGFEVKVGLVPAGLYLLSLVDEHNTKIITSKVLIK